jgi:ESS family glutamate:Na+ symporter
MLHYIVPIIIAAVLVGVGSLVIKAQPILTRLNFTPSIIGGFIGFIALHTVALWRDETRPLVTVPPSLRDSLLILFFISIGLSLHPSYIRAVKKEVIILTLATILLILLQNSIAVGLATLFNHEPLFGLTFGSLSYVGGLGSAVAWGGVLESKGIIGATEAGIISATIGLIIGGLLAGPMVTVLMRHYSLIPRGSETLSPKHSTSKVATSPPSRLIRRSSWWHILFALFLFALCYTAGDLLQALIREYVTLPRFLTAMIVAVICALFLSILKLTSSEKAIATIGNYSLHIFITLSLTMLNTDSVSDTIHIIVVAAIIQTVTTLGVTYYFVFKKLGSDYDAAVMSGAVIGYGLSSFSIAMATMQQTIRTYGPAPRALKAISVVGAALVDILNAAIIGICIALL